jgi:hypothetical protein
VSVVGGIHLAFHWFIQTNVDSLTLNDGMLQEKIIIKTRGYYFFGGCEHELGVRVLTYLLKSAGSTISVVRSESTIEMPNRI